MASGDVPLWWVGLTVAILLVSIVIGALILAVFNLTANEWALPALVGCVSGGFTLLLLFPVLRRMPPETAASPPLLGKS